MSTLRMDINDVNDLSLYFQISNKYMLYIIFFVSFVGISFLAKQHVHKYVTFFFQFHLPHYAITDNIHTTLKIGEI